jgi:hypothetical protein
LRWLLWNRHSRKRHRFSWQQKLVYRRNTLRRLAEWQRSVVNKRGDRLRLHQRQRQRRIFPSRTIFRRDMRTTTLALLSALKSCDVTSRSECPNRRFNAVGAVSVVGVYVSSLSYDVKTRRRRRRRRMQQQDPHRRLSRSPREVSTQLQCFHLRCNHKR